MASSLSGLCSDGWESEDADGCSLPLVSPLLLWSFYSPISLRLFFEALREQCGKIGSTVERLRFSNVVVLLLEYRVFVLKKKKKHCLQPITPFQHVAIGAFVKSSFKNRYKTVDP